MDVIRMHQKISNISDEAFLMPKLPDAAFSFARPSVAPAFLLGEML